MDDKFLLHFAIEDFRRARQAAAMQEIIARFTGRETGLLAYDEVRQKLNIVEGAGKKLEEIPLDSIVGSVNRYEDFTRSFLPRKDSDKDRWARVMVGVKDTSGLPPIEVYQIGDVYFVADGNHRVSVARYLEANQIQAYVTQVQTKVPLSPDIHPDDLIVKAEFADFLEKTHLDVLRPQVDFSLTAPGKYQVLLGQIDVVHSEMSEAKGAQVPFQDAVLQWCDEVYMPLIEVILERTILRDFPERTETDLYLWISEHHSELFTELGWDVSMESSAADLTARFSPKKGIADWVKKSILDAVKPGRLMKGPPPGKWREERFATPTGQIFSGILIAITGHDTGWDALELGLEFATREDARIFGLHIVPSTEGEKETDLQRIRSEFDKRCKAAGITGNLTIEVGNPAQIIVDRARWTDLAIVPLTHPPESGRISRLTSGFRSLVQRSSPPVLAVKGKISPLRRILLAYDGSLMANEALFLAAYLSTFWDLSLYVISVLEHNHVTHDTLIHARDYLDTYGVQAQYIERSGPVAEAILEMAETQQIDLVIIGSYGSNHILGTMFGSTVDQVLQNSQKPVLICR